jgi:hypothetical protein
MPVAVYPSLKTVCSRGRGCVKNWTYMNTTWSSGKSRYVLHSSDVNASFKVRIFDSAWVNARVTANAVNGDVHQHQHLDESSDFTTDAYIWDSALQPTKCSSEAFVGYSIRSYLLERVSICLRPNEDHSQCPKLVGRNACD